MFWMMKAGLYGAMAGVVTAITLWAMKFLEHAVWAWGSGPLHIVCVVMTGGMLIAWLRHYFPKASLQALILASQHPVQLQRKWVLSVALTAIVAVAFGGAVGPEAGLIAVVLEISSLVVMRLSRDRAQQRALSEVAVAASLSAWYGSPPAAASQVQTDERLPVPLLWWAALMGLLGFGLTAQHLLGGGMHRLELPAHTPAADGTDLLWSVLPALMGVLTGVLFAKLLPQCRALLARVGGPVRQTLLGSAIFAGLAAAVPELRFSGHHELALLPNWLAQWGAAAVLALACLKVLALSICLASGWLGGAIFPLLMAGACAGLATTALLPGMPVSLALVAGMSGAATVGMGKPMVAALILVFVAGVHTLPAVCVGVLAGYGVLRLWPCPVEH